MKSVSFWGGAHYWPLLGRAGRSWDLGLLPVSFFRIQTPTEPRSSASPTPLIIPQPEPPQLPVLDVNTLTVTPNLWMPDTGSTKSRARKLSHSSLSQRLGPPPGKEIHSAIKIQLDSPYNLLQAVPVPLTTLALWYSKVGAGLPDHYCMRFPEGPHLCPVPQIGIGSAQGQG